MSTQLKRKSVQKRKMCLKEVAVYSVFTTSVLVFPRFKDESLFKT